MAYQLNEQLELPVRDLRVDTKTEAKYAVVFDGDREYRIYNLLNCQKEELPDKMYVKVFYVSQNVVKFKQDEERLFKEHYKVGKLYRFDVTDVKRDYKSDTPYYIIEDDFASHRYYFDSKAEQKYNTGDSCILEVTGFKDNGFLKLQEFEHVVDTDIKEEEETKVEETTTINEKYRDLPILEELEEDSKTELKTSIAFPPGNKGEADIDTQLFNILMELTAFMNTEGGTLYIGIHDKSKKVVGITDDYAHLNDGSKDQYNGSYPESNDGYQLKIRNTIDRLCPSVANNLINITFEKIGSAEYCKIVVDKAKRPIWLQGNQLYVRQGNRKKLLRGDEITFFITERMSLSIQDIIDVDDLPIPRATLDEKKLRDIIHKLINDIGVKPQPQPNPQPDPQDQFTLPPPPSLDEIDYWIVWNEDRTWLRQRNKANDDRLQVPVYKRMSNPLVVFCYENNRVNVVKLSVLRRNVNLKVPQNNGWSEDNGKPMNIFIAEPSSLIAIHSIDCHNIAHVKLHALTDFTPTQSGRNMGAIILPDANQVLSYSIIGAEHQVNLQHFIFPKGRRTQDAGVPLNTPTFANEIGYLQNIGKQ